MRSQYGCTWLHMTMAHMTMAHMTVAHMTVALRGAVRE
jgi:hypothetical protein